MSPNRRRWALVASVALVVGALAYLVLGSFRQALVYYYTPSEILEMGSRIYGKTIRVGGVVREGSLERTPGSLRLRFAITDGQQEVPVVFEGVPPDLFREGKGAVAEGRWTPQGVFRADLIMAKHSEEYRPPASPADAAAVRERSTLAP